MKNDQLCIALRSPDPTLKIRPVRSPDAEVLRAQCWPDRPQAIIDQLVNRAQQIAYQGRGLGVVTMGDSPGDIRGFGQLTMWPRGGEISDLVVSEALRGRGLGTAIIQYLVRAAREMHASNIEIGVAYSNPGALALYRRLGFKDDHDVMLNLGQGLEPVLYLQLDLPPYVPSIRRN